MSKKISVIVPVYNSEAHLNRCLETLVHQTLDGIEILVVNDGSTDSSQRIIDEYAAEYPDVVIPLWKQNGGLSDARNFGISHATGEYLGFVDSDDFVDLDMYERLYQKANQTDSDIVFHPMTYAHTEKRVRKYFTASLDLFGHSIAESPRTLLYANSFAVNKIYRRTFWLRGRFQFPVGQSFEDSALIYNVLYAANRVECVNIPFYYYVRDREESITNAFDNRIYDIFKSCDSMLEFYRRQPNYSNLKDSIEFLCISHIFVRFDLLARCDDRQFVRRFLDAAYAYLEAQIPDWRENSYFDTGRTQKLPTQIKRKIRSQPKVSKVYYTAPRGPRKAARRLLELRDRVAVPALPARKQAQKQAQTPSQSWERRQSERIQANGYQLIAAVQHLLDREGIEVFADFGTLLGIVREGRLLAHDLDIDMGVVVKDDLDMLRVRTALERFGFKVWREYYIDDQVVEVSFRLFGVKLDINYYRTDENASRTWLFYRDPEKEYGPRERDVVEMRYSPIRGFTTMLIHGVHIRVPLDAESLLAEKYGPTWRTPDKGWIYWQSPAATPLKTHGSFLTYSYPGGFVRVHDEADADVYERLFERTLVRTGHEDKDRERTHDLQALQLVILKEFDELCRRHELTYYLSYGALVGALRHQGFIPWEASVAVSMPRDAYERLARLTPDAVPQGFEIQHWRRTPPYWATSIKVRMLANDEFYQPSIAHITEHNGPYIDVFPLDSVPAQGSDVLERQKRAVVRYRDALNYKFGLARPKTWRSRGVWLWSRIVTVESLHRKIEESSRRQEAPDNEWVVNLASAYSVEKDTFPIGAYGEPRYVPFEDTQLPGPARAEEILSRIYGPNYAKLPEIDKRMPRHSMRSRLDDADA